MRGTDFSGGERDGALSCAGSGCSHERYEACGKGAGGAHPERVQRDVPSFGDAFCWAQRWGLTSTGGIQRIYGIWMGKREFRSVLRPRFEMPRWDERLVKKRV